MDISKLCSRFFSDDKNKEQIRILLKPIINIILHELKPYMYAIIIFISIIFLLILSIFVLQIKLYIAKSSLPISKAHIF